MKFKKTNTLLLFCCLLAADLAAQVFSCECGQVRLSKVTAPSGLVLREKTSKESKKVLAIPFNEVVSVCEIYFPEPVQENIEGIGWGRWERVMYQGQEGYVFDYYLDKNPMIEIIHAEYEEPLEFWPRPVVALTSGTPIHKGYQTFWMKNMELKKRVSAIGETWLEIEQKERENARFFIGGIAPKPHGIHGYISEYYGKDEILPGTYTEIDLGEKRYAIYATGEVLTDKSRIPRIAGKGPYLLIRDYKVFYANIDEPSSKPQLLAHQAEIVLDKPEFGTSLLALDFFGDLDGDNLPDLLLNQRGSYGSSILLFLSSKAEPGYFLKIVRKVGLSCC